jgi:hypothetical protein
MTQDAVSLATARGMRRREGGGQAFLRERQNKGIPGPRPACRERDDPPQNRSGQARGTLHCKDFNATVKQVRG